METNVVPEGLLAWLAVGLCVGWLATNWVAQRPTSDWAPNPAGDVTAGLAGGVAAGLLFSHLASGPQVLFGSLLAATVGAGLLIAGVRAAGRQWTRR